MNSNLNLILAFSLIAGQLLKLPVFGQASLTLLDLTTFILLGFGWLKFKPPLTRPPRFISAGLIFLLIGTISLVFSPLHLNLTEKINSLLYGVRFLAILVLGWLIYLRCLPFSLNDLAKIWLSSGITIAVLGLLQFLLLPDLGFLAQAGWDPHLYRLASTFLDPNFTGAYLALTLSGLFLFPQSKLRYRWYFFILVYLGLLLTFSRSAYLMFIVTFLIISLLQKSIKILLLTLILSLILFIGFSIYQKTVAQVHNVNRTQSAETRVSSWQQGLAIWQKNPILGVGFNSYRYGLKEYQLGPDIQIQSHGGSSNDSSLLYVLDTTGVIGLISYIWFIFEILKIGWRNLNHNRVISVILMSVVFGLLAQSFLINTMFYPFLLIWLILLPASLLTEPKSPP